MDALAEDVRFESNLAGLINDLRAALGDDGVADLDPDRLRIRLRVRRSGRRPETARAPLARHRLHWAGREVALPEGSTVLGRDASADVLVADGSVSRQHARIDVRGDTATLEDLGSKNGTWRGGERVSSRVTLENADEIRLGKVAMIFVTASSDAPTETAV